MVQKRYTVESYYRVVDNPTFGATRIVTEEIHNRTDAELLASRLNTAIEIGIEQGIKTGEAQERENWTHSVIDSTPETKF